jgi:hypothetical protein
VGRLGLGLQSERRLVSAAQVGRTQKHAVGRIWPRADIVFLCFYLQNTVLIVFVQILSKFQIVFSIQIIPTKVCLENSKVTEIFLKSLKLMNFNSFFPLQNFKVIA